jgi:anthranilate synthase component 2
MREKLVVIDNYDSFTFNLVQYLGELGEDVTVHRNDVSLDAVEEEPPFAIVLSPGPKTPSQAGICNALIERLAPSVPILGVCLGHECIAEVFGATIGPAPRLMHGKVSQVTHRGDPLFRGLANPFPATRYHSLCVDPKSLPSTLTVTAWAEDGTVMGIRHRSFPVFGVQFHPESILTEGGHQLLNNFLDEARSDKSLRRPAKLEVGASTGRGSQMRTPRLVGADQRFLLERQGDLIPAIEEAIPIEGVDRK